MNRTAMDAEAKVINKANFEKRGITWCESCGTSEGLTFAHRQKRRHYRTVEELTDYNDVILLCMREHQIIEKSKKLTDEMFNRLRDPK
jgi:hypothetical protein